MQNQPSASCVVMLGRAWMIASRVRASTRRKMAFSLENASSIGERSGEYEGRNRSWQPPFFDGLFDLGSLMDRKIVQDHDLSWTKQSNQVALMRSILDTRQASPRLLTSEILRAQTRFKHLH